MGQQELTSETPQSVIVPWRVRDVLIVLFWRYFLAALFEVGVVIIIVLSYAAHDSAVQAAGLSERLRPLFVSPWLDMFYLFEAFLTLLLILFCLLRPYRISMRRFFGFSSAQRNVSHAISIALLVVTIRNLLWLGSLWALHEGFSGEKRPHVCWHSLKQAHGEGLPGYSPENVAARRVHWSLEVFMIFLAPPVEELLFRGCL